MTRLANPRLEAGGTTEWWGGAKTSAVADARYRARCSHRPGAPRHPASRRGLIALSLLALAACQQQAEQPAKNKVAAAAPAQPGAPKVTIAAKYRGEWSLDLRTCGGQTDQRLIVKADSINFYGTNAPLTRLEDQPDGSVEALAHVSDNTGGYDVVNRYRLSEDGRSMTLTGAVDQPPVKLKRCPEQAA